MLQLLHALELDPLPNKRPLRQSHSAPSPLPFTVKQNKNIKQKLKEEANDEQRKRKLI